MNFKKIKLRDILSQPIQNGYSPICPERPTGKWILGLGALNGHGLDINKIKPAPLTDSRVDNFILNKGDFLISRSNTIDKVGRSALYRGELNNCSFPDLIMRFRVDDSQIYPEFLESCLKGPETIRYFQRSASGTSGSMVKINKKVVENLQIPLLPYQDQMAIADLLSKWDSVIRNTEDLIYLKEKYYNWVLQRINSNTEYPKLHIRDLTSEISIRNIDQRLTLVLSVTNKSGFVLPENQFDRRIASSDLSNYKIVTKGQYAYNPSRINVGSIARLDCWNEGVLSPMYVVFDLNERYVLSDYFFHWLQSYEAKQRIAKSTQGSVRESVNFDDFGAILITLPTIKQQTNIVYVLNTFQNEIELLKNLANSYRKQKKGLMQKLLTGDWGIEFKKIS